MGEWDQQILDKNTGMIQTFYRKTATETVHAQTKLKEMWQESTITKSQQLRDQQQICGLWSTTPKPTTNYTKKTAIIEKENEGTQSKEIHVGHTWASQAVLTQLPVFSLLPGPVKLLSPYALSLYPSNHHPSSSLFPPPVYVFLSKPLPALLFTGQQACRLQPPPWLLFPFATCPNAARFLAEKGSPPSLQKLSRVVPKPNGKPLVFEGVYTR